MDENPILEGVFAIAKPAHVSSADVLQKLQATFATSKLFAPLLAHQPKRASKDESNVFRMGHGGTLDPLASGILICGIGRGTKHLNRYLASTKTYETTVQFGSSTDTYDCTGTIVEEQPHKHVTKGLVSEALAQFRGTFQQTPPAYSALKINGIKACEYVRQGKELPVELESREMHVERCEMLGWDDVGKHLRTETVGESSEPGPEAQILLTVCSGFYVRSFAHDLGRACNSCSHMVSLNRTRQAKFILDQSVEPSPDLTVAITYADLEAGENVWGLKLKPQLEEWVKSNPLVTGHVNGRDQQTKKKMAAERAERPRQRFRGGWMADDKKERINQQGGKVKGKRNRTKTPTTEVETENSQGVIDP